MEVQANLSPLIWKKIQLFDYKDNYTVTITRRQNQLDIQQHLIQTCFENIFVKECPYLREAIITSSNRYFLMFMSISWQLAKFKIFNFKQIRINIADNSINDRGCELIAKGNWPLLLSINLSNNKIGNEGCRFLSKAQWGKIQQMLLDNNLISSKGCEYLIQAEWTPKICVLSINMNMLEDEGIKIICVKSGQNKITEIGIQYLIKADWQHIQGVYLKDSLLGAQGLYHMFNKESVSEDQSSLSQTILENNLDLKQISELSTVNLVKEIKDPLWNRLSQLVIQNCSIGNLGCKYLCLSRWHLLSYLNIIGNRIEDEGCQYLSRCQWGKLKQMDFRSIIDDPKQNNITQLGLRKLGKANWPSFKYLWIIYGDINQEFYDLSQLIGALKVYKFQFSQIIIVQRQYDTDYE